MVAGYIEYPICTFFMEQEKKNKYIKYFRPPSHPNLSNRVRFFYSNSNLKVYWKIDFFSFWQDLGIGKWFSIQKYEKIDFSAFGKILVLAFFDWNSNLKSLEKLIFSAFGFGECLFLFKFKLKNIENWFFQLLARSWFLANAFLYSNSNYNDYWKFDFFNFWQDLGFDECFFLFKF